MRKRSKNGQFRKTSGTGKEPIDHYPMIDQYIPDAVLIANDKFNPKKEQINKWNQYFMSAMDEILSKKGFRVL